MPGPTRPDPAGGGLGFVPGDLLRYRFAQSRAILSTAPSYAGPGFEAPQLATRMTLSGLLSVTVYEADAKGWLVGLRMTEIECSFASGDQSTDPGLELDGEALVRIDASGRIEKLRLPDQANTTARAGWKDVLSQWQVQLAPNEESSWVIEGEDSVGTFKTRYERIDDGLVRTKIAYDRLHGFAQQAGMTATVSGSASIALDPLPARIEGREKLVIAAKGETTRIECDLQYSFVRVHASRVAVEARTLGDTTTTLADAEQPEPAPLGDDEAIRGVQTCFERAAGAAEDDAHTAYDLLGTLAELMEQSDAAVRSAFAKINRRLDRNAGLVISALGAAGTRTAQQKLVNLLTDQRWTDTHHRDLALRSVLQIEQPSPELDVALGGMVRDQDNPNRDNALLVLAAIGSKVRDQKERFAAIEKEVMQGLGPDADPADRSLALEAIGNLGPAKVPAAVRNALEDEDEKIRLSAVRALLLIPTGTASSLLLERVLTDEDDHVRYEALKTLVRRHEQGWGKSPDPIEEILDRVATDDPSEMVRERAGMLRKSIQEPEEQA